MCSFWLVCLFMHLITVLEAPSQMLRIKWEATPDTSPTLSLLSWGYSPIGKRDINQPTFLLSVWLQSGICTLNLRECGESDPDPQLKTSLRKWHVNWDSHLTRDGWSKMWKWVNLVLDVRPPLLHLISPHLGSCCFHIASIALAIPYVRHLSSDHPPDLLPLIRTYLSGVPFPYAWLRAKLSLKWHFFSIKFLHFIRGF